jgi:hypothetical protein
MLKPLLMSFAVTSLGVSAIGADESTPNPATWRWHVTQILSEQRANADPRATVGAISPAVFGQRYERYSGVGLPEPSTRADVK